MKVCMGWLVKTNFPISDFIHMTMEAIVNLRTIYIKELYYSSFVSLLNSVLDWLDEYGGQTRQICESISSICKQVHVFKVSLLSSFFGLYAL